MTTKVGIHLRRKIMQKYKATGQQVEDYFGRFGKFVQEEKRLDSKNPFYADYLIHDEARTQLSIFMSQFFFMGDMDVIYCDMSTLKELLWGEKDFVMDNALSTLSGTLYNIYLDDVLVGYMHDAVGDLYILALKEGIL